MYLHTRPSSIAEVETRNPSWQVGHAYDCFWDAVESQAAVTHRETELVETQPPPGDAYEAFLESPES